MTQKLGKYTIVEKLGEGSMGAVYKAYDGVLDRYVAIKTMASDIQWNPELKLRFYREAKSAANIHHPNIVTIHDLGEEGKTTFIVMELLEGSDLKKIIRDRVSLSLEQKLSIISQMADALTHAHLNGIIHRDIKPGNIHVTGTGTVKILDFGIAHIPSSDLTQTGTRLGTPVYMSPEQIRGKDYDARSDIFSTGIVFYELITSVHPFRDKKIAKTLDNILFQSSFSFKEQFPDAPPGLWPIISKCLEKDPSKRYASMADLSLACRNLLSELTLASHKICQALEESLPLVGTIAAEKRIPPASLEIYEEARRLLGQKERPDYLTLLRLEARLAREPLWQEVKGIKAQPAPAPGQAQAQKPIPPAVSPVSKPPVASEIHAPEAREQLTPAPSADLQSDSSVPLVEAPSPAAQQARREVDERRGNELTRSAETLVQQGRHEEAIERLRIAIGLLGPRDNLVQMLADTRQAIEDRRLGRIKEFLEAASAALIAGQLTEATEAVDQALAMEPDQREALEMRRKILEAAEAEKARQAKKAEGEQEKNLGLKLLAEKQFRESLDALKHAAELLGEDTAIRLGIKEAQEGLKAAELRAKAQSELDEALRLFRTHDFEKARAQVHKVFDLTPRNHLARALLHRIDQAQEEQRKRDEVASLLSRAETAMKDGDWKTVATLASEAHSLDPTNRQSERLLARAEETQDQQRRQAEANDHFARAEKLIEQQAFDEAEAVTKQTLALTPEDARATDFLKRIREAREGQRRQEEVQRFATEAEDAILRSDFDRCESLARRILQIEPDNSQARDLLSRSAQSRAHQKEETIRAILQPGRDAFKAGNFAEASICARKALQADPENSNAAALLSEAEQAEKNRREEEIAGLLQTSREAHHAAQFEDASGLAQKVLVLDSKHNEAKQLLREIDKAKRAWDKVQKALQKQQERQSGPPQARETAPVSPRETAATEASAAEETLILASSKRGMNWKLPAGIAVAVLVVLGVALGIYHWRGSQPQEPAVDLSPRFTEARSSLEQRQYDRAIETAQGILALSPGNNEAQAIITQAQEQKRQSQIDILMLEAQNQRSQNLLDESIVTLQKVLDIDPSYPPALAVRSEIETEISARTSREEEETAIKDWLARSNAFLASGKLSEAKSELDKVERLRPDAPGLASLRKRIAARTAEYERKQKEQTLTAQKEKSTSDLSERAEELYRQGKYSEAQVLVDQWLIQTPQDTRAHNLKNQVNEALSSMKVYEASMTGKGYDAALGAVARLEKANPSDPNIAELRHRAESKKAAAKATFSIFRLAEPGVLTLDGQPVGTGGEVEDMAVSTGRHRLAVRGSSGKQSSLELEFIDGQNLKFVYDATDLRAMTNSDPDAIAVRKQREEIRLFPVEHQHGFLRGNCSGNLYISGLTLQYRPTEGDHGFSVPFHDLTISLKDDKVEFTDKVKKQSWEFKAENKSQAQAIKKYWDTLEKLGK